MKNILYLHAGAELYGADIVLLELLKKIDKTKFQFDFLCNSYEKIALLFARQLIKRYK